MFVALLSCCNYTCCCWKFHQGETLLDFFMTIKPSKSNEVYKIMIDLFRFFSFLQTNCNNTHLMCVPVRSVKIPARTIQTRKKNKKLLLVATTVCMSHPTQSCAYNQLTRTSGYQTHKEIGRDDWAVKYCCKNGLR